MNTMAYSNIFKSMTKYDKLYLEDYEYNKGVVFCRTRVFGIWIQFLIWKYILKSYFVVITPKYAFLKVR